MRLDADERIILTRERERAYNKGVETLRGRKSLAQTLTQEQIDSADQHPYYFGSQNERY